MHRNCNVKFFLIVKKNVLVLLLTSPPLSSISLPTLQQLQQLMLLTEAWRRIRPELQLKITVRPHLAHICSYIVIYIFFPIIIYTTGVPIGSHLLMPIYHSPAGEPMLSLKGCMCLMNGKIEHEERDVEFVLWISVQWDHYVSWFTFHTLANKKLSYWQMPQVVWYLFSCRRPVL